MSPLPFAASITARSRSTSAPESSALARAIARIDTSSAATGLGLSQLDEPFPHAFEFGLGCIAPLFQLLAKGREQDLEAVGASSIALSMSRFPLFSAFGIALTALGIVRAIQAGLGRPDDRGLAAPECGADWPGGSADHGASHGGRLAVPRYLPLAA